VVKFRGQNAKLCKLHLCAIRKLCFIMCRQRYTPSFCLKGR